MLKVGDMLTGKYRLLLLALTLLVAGCEFLMPPPPESELLLDVWSVEPLAVLRVRAKQYNNDGSVRISTRTPSPRMAC